MRILADENVARDIVAWLRSGGHDVLFAAETSPGTADARWVHIAEQEQRVILTSDKDFGELVFRDGLTSHGVVLLRLDELPVPAILARLRAVWSVVEANPARRFIVITEKKVRVRATREPG
jgi:predicted nuclease of predicted toxin-antitoxin system